MGRQKARENPTRRIRLRLQRAPAFQDGIMLFLDQKRTHEPIGPPCDSPNGLYSAQRLAEDQGSAYTPFYLAMNKGRQFEYVFARRRFRLGAAGLMCSLCLLLSACRSPQREKIAVIPQTEGTILWETAHAGVETAALTTGESIYWNAPTREDDVEAQVTLVDRIVSSGQYSGLVLAPNQTFSLISPVRRAMSKGIPTVIIGSPLSIPPGGDLFYILNNDEVGGELAAQRVAGLLHGHGTVALLGINPDVTGIMIRARAFERSLSENYPGINIVEKRMGSFNVPHEQQVAEDTIRANPSLDAIVALMWTSVDGTLSALDSMPEGHSIKVIGFDSAEALRFAQKPNLDCVIQEDIRSMGQQAIELIHSRLLGRSVPALVRLPPKLITRDNLNAPEIRRMLSQDWQFGRWRWSSAQ